MKFILTGCTGFIGKEVLNQALKNPAITSIVALSRRQLPEPITANPKLKVILMKDFNTYPDSVLKELSGADACIWCMGTTGGVRVLEIDYPLAFANAFSGTLSETGTKFRYIHLSGAVTERNQDSSLWFKSDLRKMKGQAETNMLSYTTKPETKGLWETLIVKAGFVFENSYTARHMIGWMVGEGKCIQKDELAAVLIDAASNGWKEDTLTDNKAMVLKGRECLAQMEK